MSSLWSFLPAQHCIMVATVKIKSTSNTLLAIISWSIDIGNLSWKAYRRAPYPLSFRKCCMTFGDSWFYVIRMTILRDYFSCSVVFHFSCWSRLCAVWADCGEYKAKVTQRRGVLQFCSQKCEGRLVPLWNSQVLKSNDDINGPIYRNQKVLEKGMPVSFSFRPSRSIVSECKWDHLESCKGFCATMRNTELSQHQSCRPEVGKL